MILEKDECLFLKEILTLRKENAKLQYSSNNITYEKYKSNIKLCSTLETKIKNYENLKFNPLVQHSINLSETLHKNHKRDNGLPYTHHTNLVLELLLLVSSDLDLLASAPLHDALEDCKITEHDLLLEVGSVTTNYILEVTKTSENTFPHLHSRNAYLLKFADRLQNLSDMITWSPSQISTYLSKSIFWSTKEPLTSQNAPESTTKKCPCGQPAVGVISMFLGHQYVCRKCAKNKETEGWVVDYENWRL